MAVTRAARRAAAISLAALAAGGCISSMRSGDVTALRPVTAAPRVGQVVLIRGLIGLFSVGIDTLGDEINASGITAHVFQETQDPAIADAIIANYGPAASASASASTAASASASASGSTGPRAPLVLIGHSVGAEDVITIARKLAAHGIGVDLMICLDATNPDTVPANVVRCVNYYQSSWMDHLPILRGLPLRGDADFHGGLENLDVRRDRRDLLEWDTNHFNIDKDAKIHADILRRLKTLCVVRPPATTRGPD